MMRKQLFVECRCDLGQENWVLVVLKQLRFLREPAVHRVTSLMRQRVNIGEDIVLVIYQDVRWPAVASRRKRAAALAFTFVPITPALRAQTLRQDVDVFLPERSQRA